ncbi:hypothetical protein [Haloplanus salilacus]|uniref:hypothetical protein n=1 Tax=Haloplanus salilacus TaxID=2949994 RepID=UPI0030CF7788
MRSTTHRRLCGVLGGLLVALVVGVVAAVGIAPLRAPVVATQVSLLGLSGAFDLLAAVETPITERVAWYRLSGVANVALGLALPVGLLGWTGTGTGGTVLLVVTAVGGLALVGVGVDLALFAGEHVYQRPLEE